MKRGRTAAEPRQNYMRRLAISASSAALRRPPPPSAAVYDLVARPQARRRPVAIAHGASSRLASHGRRASQVASADRVDVAAAGDGRRAPAAAAGRAPRNAGPPNSATPFCLCASLAASLRRQPSQAPFLCLLLACATVNFAVRGHTGAVSGWDGGGGRPRRPAEAGGANGAKTCGRNMDMQPWSRAALILPWGARPGRGGAGALRGRARVGPKALG